MSPRASPLLPRDRGRSLVLPLLVLAVLAAAMFAFLLRPDADRKPEGLTVDVTVVDAEGAPVPQAQVQARYRPKWHTVGAGGTLRLAGVILRADDAPTPDAVARALDARSATYARRRPPEVTYTPDDGWKARFVLEPFGTVRLRIGNTNLAGVKAWVILDPSRGSIDSVSGIEVARPGQAASWRVFGGVETVDVRIEGAMGTAARVLRLEAPAAGFVREFGLDAEPSMPIRGKIAPATGSPDGEDVPLPSLRGRMEVVELTEDGREVRHLPVWIQDDGSFEVSYAGEGRYELTPILYYAEVEPRRVRGGDTIDFTDVEPRPWLVLPPGDLTASDRPIPTIRVVKTTEDGEVPVGSWSLFSEDEGWMLSVPGPGRYRVHATRPGTNDAPPASGSAEVAVAGSGPHPVALALEPVPSGTLAVRVEAPQEGGGADVYVVEPGDRRATILFAFGDTARFPNVRAGPFRLRVLFTDREIAVFFLAGEVEAGETAACTAKAIVGGALVAVGRGAGLADDGGSRRVSWHAGASPYGDAPGDVVLVREPGTPRWRSARRLAPGRYRAALTQDGNADLAAEDVEFEVIAGETTEIGIDVP